MTETETMELIKVKKEDLAKRRSQPGVDSTLLKTLEDEIMEHVADEEGHIELWLRFAEALGLEKADPTNVPRRMCRVALATLSFTSPKGYNV